MFTRVGHATMIEEPVLPDASRPGEVREARSSICALSRKASGGENKHIKTRAWKSFVKQNFWRRKPNIISCCKKAAALLTRHLNVPTATLTTLPWQCVRRHGGENDGRVGDGNKPFTFVYFESDQAAKKTRDVANSGSLS